MLFNHAPLFLYGGLSFNPINEWLNHHSHGQVVYVLSLDADILLTGNPQTNRTLWAVEKQYWDSLSLHIGGLALLDRSKGTFMRPVCQQLKVPDVNAKSPFSTAEIFTFGVDSNKVCIVFEPPIPPSLLPRVYRRHPLPETLKLSTLLLSNHPNPYSQLQE